MILTMDKMCLDKMILGVIEVQTIFFTDIMGNGPNNDGPNGYWIKSYTFFISGSGN